jgi:hypothetical protein
MEIVELMLEFYEELHIVNILTKEQYSELVKKINS